MRRWLQFGSVITAAFSNQVPSRTAAALISPVTVASCSRYAAITVSRSPLK